MVAEGEEEKLVISKVRATPRTQFKQVDGLPRNVI